MSSPTINRVSNAQLIESVQESCRDLVDSFATFTSSPPIELLEDARITVNCLLSSRYPPVKVEIDRYAPELRSGALRLIKGAYVSGIPLTWTDESIHMNDGDFIARFDQDEANRAALAHAMMAYVLDFLASHLQPE